MHELVVVDVQTSFWLEVVFSTGSTGNEKLRASSFAFGRLLDLFPAGGEELQLFVPGCCYSVRRRVLAA